MTSTSHPTPTAPGDRPPTARSGSPRTAALVAGLVCLALALGACSTSADVSTASGSTSSPATTKSAGGADADRTTVGSTPGTAPGTTATTRATTSTPLTTEVAPTTVTTKGPVTTKPPATAPGGGPVTTVANTPADAAFCAKGKAMDDTLGDASDTAPFLAKIKQAFADLTAAAPPEIRADMESINTVVQAATTLDSLEELDEATEKRLDDASERVDAWALAHCGSDFNS